MNKMSLSFLFVFSVGVACLIFFQRIGGSIDEQGILHEPFFLLPIGWALMIGAGLSILILTFARAKRND